MPSTEWNCWSCGKHIAAGQWLCEMASPWCTLCGTRMCPGPHPLDSHASVCNGGLYTVMSSLSPHDALVTNKSGTIRHTIPEAVIRKWNIR